MAITNPNPFAFAERKPSKLFATIGRKPPSSKLRHTLTPKEPRTLRIKYQNKLDSIWDLFNTAARVAMGVRADTRVVRVDSPKLIATFDQLLQNAHLPQFLDQLGADLADRGEKYMRQVVRVPTTIKGKEQLIAQYREENLKLIKNVSQEQIAKIDKILQAQSFGIRAEDMGDQIQEALNFGNYRSQLIARDQTLKGAATFNRVAQESAGITHYVWSTSQDERVRPEHADLDGETFAYDDPPDTGNGRNNPGEDIQCRCSAIPVIPIFNNLTGLE